MAVFDPRPSQDPGYSDVAKQLEQRANLELQRPSPLGIATQVVQRVDKELTASREFEKKLKSEGRKLLTPEIAKEMIADNPDILEEDLTPFSGLYIKPDELEKHLTQKQLTRAEKQGMENIKQNVGKPGYPTQAQYDSLLAGGPEGMKQFVQSQFPEVKATSKVAIADPTSSTGLRWATQFSDGRIVPTEFEAPKSAAGGSASLTPAKREESLRKEFTARVKDAGFQNHAEAYTQAQNSLKKVSITNDRALIYAVARARDRSGRLSVDDVRQAEQAGSLSQDLMQHLNKLKGDQQLEPEVRQALADSVKQVYDAAEKNLTQLEDTYKGLAEAEPGIDANHVIVPFRPKITTTKIQKDPITGKRYEVEIAADGTKKVIRELP